MTRAFTRLLFQNGATGLEASLHKIVMGNFIVCQDRIKRNLLQLFAHPGHSEWCSIVSVIIFAVDIVGERKQAYLKCFRLFF